MTEEQAAKVIAALPWMPMIVSATLILLAALVLYG